MVLARLHRGWNEDWVFTWGEAFETIRPLARAPALASAVLVAIMPCLRGLTYYIQTPLEWRVDAKGEEEGPQQGGDRVDSPLRPSPGCCWHTAQRARSFALSLARFPSLAPSLKPPPVFLCLPYWCLWTFDSAARLWLRNGCPCTPATRCPETSHLYVPRISLPIACAPLLSSLYF
jgi:hypothetical protein